MGRGVAGVRARKNVGGIDSFCLERMQLNRSGGKQI